MEAEKQLEICDFELQSLFTRKSKIKNIMARQFIPGLTG
jgi:hypothetical protein